MRILIKTFIERKHLRVYDGDWRQVAHSESLCSQYDRWVISLESGSGIYVVDTVRRDYVEQLGEDYLLCHLLVVHYVPRQAAREYGWVDREYEAEPHEAAAYEALRRSFFSVPRVGRVCCLRRTPILTFFDKGSDIDLLDLDDYNDLPVIPAIYDYVVCDGVLSQGCPQAVFDQALRVLKPGGHIICFETLFSTWRYAKRTSVDVELVRRLFGRCSEAVVMSSGNEAMAGRIDGAGRWKLTPPDELRRILADQTARPLFVWAHGKL